MKNFIRRTELPNQKIRLNIDNQILTEIAIDVLNNKGIPVYHSTLESGYDSEYPYLLWDRNQLTQVGVNYGPYNLIDCVSLEEFFSHFFESSVTSIKLTDQYSAEIKAFSIKVGCQIIDFDTIEQIYSKMLELQGKR